MPQSLTTSITTFAIRLSILTPDCLFNTHSLIQLDSQIDKKLNAQFLFDQKTGKPLGQSGIGDVFDHQFLLIEKHVFGNPGKYQLKIEQFNRQDTLRGILAVGAELKNIQIK